MAHEGRDKDKGKEKGKAKAVEPAPKKRKTREQRDAEAAERATDAFDAMQSRCAGGIRIGETRQKPPRTAKLAKIPVDAQPPKGYKARTKFPMPKCQAQQRSSGRTTSAADIIAQQEV